jgi:hypothetical protein
MVLVGKNFAGYGEFLNENFIHLLESGANFTAPENPLIGQLWWDKTANTLKVYTGQGTGVDQFKPISGAIAKSTQPTGSALGDLWFDTAAGQLKVWNGSSFLLVGPASTTEEGQSGIVVSSINDSEGNPRVIVELFSQDERVAIVSRGPSFTPQQLIPGFAGVITPGIQLSTAVAGARFTGTASNAELLNGLTSSQFLRSDQSGEIGGNLTVTGAINGATINTVSSDVFVRNSNLNGNLTLTANIGGTPTVGLSIFGANANAGVRGIVNLNANGVGNIGSATNTFNQVFASALASGNIVNFANGVGNIGTAASSFNSIFVNSAGVRGIVNLNATGVGNIGSAANSFNTIFARATSASYADVAERFAADETYAPGTVVEIGGEAEVTKSVDDLSDNVFGVISTRAAYLMNATAGDDATHPPIAMTGRVPVRVVGTVKKGDRLVSAGNGLARSAQKGEITAFNVIGRALETKSDSGEGLVEAIVTINS